MVVVELDDRKALRDIRKRLGALADKAPNVLYLALDATARQATRELAERAAATYEGHKKKVFSKNMSIERPRKTKLSATIHSRGMMEELNSFKVKSSSGIVIAQVFKKSAAKDLVMDGAKAFITEFNSGHETVVQRRLGSKYTLKKYISKRLDPHQYETWDGPSDLTRIKKLLGPSIPMMVGSEEVYSDEVQAWTLEMLAQQITKRIEKTIEREAKKNDTT